MKGRFTVLDTACARVNPALALIAAVVALLDLMVASHWWAEPYAVASTQATTAAVVAEKCPLVLPSELRDLAGRD